MTSPIPRSAAPVVWFIRWWVKKPRTLPVSTGEGRWLRWFKDGMRCPLGLLPMTAVPRPSSTERAGLPNFLATGVSAFYHWWDSQTDARAAVDAVWGKNDI